MAGYGGTTARAGMNPVNSRIPALLKGDRFCIFHHR